MPPVSATLHHGDCLEVLATLPDASVDAVITDPPYGLEFMGKEWDRPWAVSPQNRVGYPGRADLTLPAHRDSRNANCRACGGRQRGAKRCACATPRWDRDPAEDMRAYGAWCAAWATACLRVLKPGGHLLAFGGTRTCHRLTSGIEDAGFDIRDTITWLYGSGFPKSMDVSKSIDKAAATRRDTIGVAADDGVARRAEPATDDARTWAGWGTALKPASEPIVVARKPLAGTVAGNVLAHGTGALNIDACRVAHASDADRHESEHKNRHADFHSKPRANHVYGADTRDWPNYNGSQGRWPTNVVLSHTVDCTGGDCAPGCPVAELDAQSGRSTSSGGRGTASGRPGSGGVYGGYKRAPGAEAGAGANAGGLGDTGGASRFFPTFRYQAKAPARERPRVDGVTHPTVKPLALLRWLIKLVVPTGALILDPFAGSGTTLEAAVLEGVDVIGVEADGTYVPLIRQRMARIGSPLNAGLVLRH